MYKIEYRRKSWNDTTQWQTYDIGLTKEEAEAVAEARTVKFGERLGHQYRIVKDTTRQSAGTSLALSQLLNK